MRPVAHEQCICREVLALEPDGTPFASLVTIATDADGTPLMLLSRLSAHTRNLLADPRCSLLFSQGGKGDPLAHPRLTVVGRPVVQARRTAISSSACSSSWSAEPAV